MPIFEVIQESFTACIRKLEGTVQAEQNRLYVHGGSCSYEEANEPTKHSPGKEFELTVAVQDQELHC